MIMCIMDAVTLLPVQCAEILTNAVTMAITVIAIDYSCSC